MLSIMVIEMAPSMNNVEAAFLLFGLRNAGTPLEMASTPVRAAQPDEKARASKKIIAICEMSPPYPGDGVIVRSALSTSGRLPSAARRAP